MNTLSQQPVVQETDPDVVEAELTRVLGERKFAGAPQMSAFLTYIVKQTLIGNADRIKAYSVGVDALGKPDTFDAQTDPSVRVLALRLRKTLKAVYSNASDNLAIIELKVGTYVPEFYKPSAGDEDVLPSSNNTDVSPTGKVAAKLMSVNPAANPSIAGSIAARWLSVDKCVIGGAVLLLAVAWQISIAQTVDDGVIAGSPPVLPAATGFTGLQYGVSGVAADSASLTARPGVPTVYIELVDSQPDLDRQLMLVLSSSFIQADTIRVVRRNESSSHAEPQFWPGEYQLVVNGFAVEDETRVDAQLVSLFNGEMLFADSITVDGIESSFSANDLLTIETMANGIVSLDGPLYRDYCRQSSSDKQMDCPAS